MILLDDIVEIFDLADFNRGAMLLVVALDRRFVGRAAIDRDLLGHTAMTANGFDQKLLGGVLVSLLGEEKIDRLAMLVHRTVQIFPLAPHLDVRLVHPPTHPNGPLTPVKRFLQQRAILDSPPVDRGVIDVHPAFLHEFLNVACAQRVRHIPANPHENDLFGKMGTLKTDRHRLSPSCITVAHRGRAYCKSPQMKICDKTHPGAGWRKRATAAGAPCPETAAAPPAGGCQVQNAPRGHRMVRSPSAVRRTTGRTWVKSKKSSGSIAASGAAES